MPPTHRYAHTKGFGAHHAEASGREQPAEMRDLDMSPDTEVEHVSTEDDTGREIVAWKDLGGNPRLTSVDPEFFGEHFAPLTTPEGM